MSIRSTAHKVFPESLWPYVQIPYRAAIALKDTLIQKIIPGNIKAETERIKKEAEKYLAYYQDDLSREIFYDRIAYLSEHDDCIFIRRAYKEGWKFRNFYESGHEKYSGIVVVYDSESLQLEYIKMLLRMFKKDYQNPVYIKLRDFLKHGKASDSDLLILTVKDWHRNLSIMRVKKYMSEHSINCDMTVGLLSIREDEQYLDVFSPADDEVVIDAGAYDGKTALRFLEWGGGKVKHVYSFELDPFNIPKCEKNLKAAGDKVTLINKGTWDKEEDLLISSNHTASGVSSEGNVKAQLTSIDSIVKDEKVTFIKMDVEGAELKSLMGARNTIIKNHPRLAICVYHKPEDIYEIPEYVLSLVPEYKFYLRHYSSREWETVLYASVN